MKTLQELTRPNIWSMQPYSSARDEYKGKAASIFLDANESPYNSPYNRYPDPLQLEIKNMLAGIKGVSSASIFLGNGSDEAIDLVFRVFCEPGKDNVVAIDPTYGMYEVCANVNGVEYRKVKLNAEFQFDADKLLETTDVHTKAIFLCSPNNPTGNNLCREEILFLLTHFDGIVLVDEAYIDFSSESSWLTQLSCYPNLIVLQTFSKAWGCAGIRLGMAFASEEIISLFNKVKYPYNINVLTQSEALKMLSQHAAVKQWVQTILIERKRLMEAFQVLPCCQQVYATDANFFLAKMTDAGKTYQRLVDNGIIVRNRSHITLCDNCLRITIGTREENDALLDVLRKE